MNNAPPTHFARILCNVSLLVMLFTVTGCLQTTAMAPRPVRFERNNTEFEGEFSDLKKKYEGAIESNGNSTTARVARDRMIFLLRVEIDKWYAQLEQELHETRAEFNSWADFLELGMAGAGAIAKPVDTKTIYATLSGVSKGTRLSIDKNWFREKATESLMNAMRTGRNAQLAQIINKMKANSAANYTFEEAWGDLIAYHQAGTIQGGLVLLAATTGEEAKKAETKVDDANKSRYPQITATTAEQVTTLEQATDKAVALSEDKLRAALLDLKVPIPDSADKMTLLGLMNTFIQNLDTTDEERLKEFITTINKL